jgi:uncharacterized protein YecT (DUF1311 family)
MAPLIFALLLASQTSEPDCAGTQSEMTQCAANDFARADATLNTVWREVTEALHERDRDAAQYAPADRGSYMEAARNAQRAWVAFRDAECGAEADNEARGGSMEPMVFHACRARLTEERTAQLRAAYLDQ